MLVQNRGDRTFAAQRASPDVVAGVAVAAQAVMEAVGTRVRVGVHVLRNDVVASLGVARAVEAHFVRAAVLTGRSTSAQGTLPGDPDAILRYRTQVRGEGIELLADVASMHNRRGVADVAEAARDAAFFGAADAVIVGSAVERGDRSGGVDPDLVRRFVAACRGG